MKIRIVSAVLMLSLLQACAGVKVEPADDGYDSRPRNGGEGWGKETSDTDSGGWLNGVIFGKKKNSSDDAQAAVERAENTNDGGANTLPPSMQKPATNSAGNSSSGNVNASSDASYRQWQEAKQKNSEEYKEFKEFKEWQEYQRSKQIK
ncbi:MAG: hypothetical protein ACRBHB_23380 [Arenicella sp.]